MNGWPFQQHNAALWHPSAQVHNNCKRATASFFFVYRCLGRKMLNASILHKLEYLWELRNCPVLLFVAGDTYMHVWILHYSVHYLRWRQGYWVKALSLQVGAHKRSSQIDCLPCLGMMGKSLCTSLQHQWLMLINTEPMDLNICTASIKALSFLTVACFLKPCCEL